MRRTPLRFLEAAYSFEVDESTWLSGLVDALEPYDLGDGIAAYTSELGDMPKVRSVENRTRLSTDMVRTMPAAMGGEFFRRCHAPMPLVHSHDFFPRVARELGIGDRFDMKAATAAGLAPTAAWAFCGGGGANRESTLVVFHCQERAAHAKRDRRLLGWLGAHVGSAMRLRAFLRAPPTADDAAVDAVMTPEGEVVHARGDAVQAETSLIEAVLRSETAKRRAATEEERLELRTAVVDGTWSILESVERDGKRFLLAMRNDPETARLRALTSREAIVAGYAALGHSFKYIAYELGIPLPTAAANLRTALRKLGVASRAELIRLFASGPPHRPT